MWSEADRLFHLQASLDGPAGQILWDAGPQSTADEVIRLLRARFGTADQAERFRAELRSRRRHKGESLQSLYNDISRLMALSFTGPSNSTTQIVGRDAFLDALDNDNLRIRILEREPQTLEAALKIASKLEAYDKSTSSAFYSHTDEKETGRERGHDKGRHVRVVTPHRAPEAGGHSDREMQALAQQVAELKTSFNDDRTLGAERFQHLGNMVCQQLQATCNALYAGGSVRAPFPTVSTYGADGAPPATKMQNGNCGPPPSTAGVQPSVANDSPSGTCFNCGDIGHWRPDCPNKRRKSRTSGSTNQGQVGVITNPHQRAEIYVRATVNGRKAITIFDMGCEHSIVSSRLVSADEMKPTDMKLFAANGTDIPLMGALAVNLMLEQVPLKAEVVVTGVIDELILGIDWLTSQGAI
jgi:hypothetical protein